MSTEYTLAKVGPAEFFACERSGAIEFGIHREDREWGRDYLDTDAVFSSDDLIEIAVKIVEIASYVEDDDPESVVSKLLATIDRNQYLRSMPKGLRHP